MLKSIRLLNWRSHSQSVLEFRKGTNLLVGIMGAGKSSILEAIAFALFGTFPAVERRKLKLENVIRLNEPDARVILDFAWEGADYRIERAIERSKKGTSSHAEIYRGNALVENGPVAVTAYVKSLTGVDYDLFTRAIYSEQNNIDYFLTLDPRRRKEEIDALLGLDRFELARSNAVAVINKLRSKREALEERFSRDRLAGLESKEKDGAAKRSELSASLGKESAALERQAKESQALADAFGRMAREREQFERLAKDEIRLSAQHSALAKELEGRSVDEAALRELEKKAAALSAERTALNGKLKAMDERNASLSKEAGSLDERLKSAAQAGEKLALVQAELESVLTGKSREALLEGQKAAEQSLISMESERKSLEHEAAELGDSLLKLKPGLSECPLCMAKLSDDGIAHVRAEKERLMAAKKARASGLSSQTAQKKTENDDLLSRIRRASMLSERAEQLRKELDTKAAMERKAALDASLAALKDERKAMHESMEKLTPELESARLAAGELKGLVSKKAEAEKLGKALAEVRGKLAGLKFDEKAFEGLRSAAERARLEAEKHQSAKKALEADIRHNDDMLKLVREELSSLRGMEKDISSLASLEEQLSVYKNALLETQASLRLGLADAINTAMNEVWGLFYPYKNYRALRLGVSERDYMFEVDDGGGWRGLETVASGGERACAALALRVALAMVLTPKLGWLILDEPTHNLDAEAVEMLSSALQFKVPEVVNQTFIITHDEAFMGSEFASSYRLSRDKERNGETKVEAM